MTWSSCSQSEILGPSIGNLIGIQIFMHYINPTKSETVEEGLTVCFNEFFKLLQ
jgi:hypothetical protein